jgi:purine-cytosine permease-like protein
MSTIAESHLSNKDLAPTGPEQRTWGTYHLAALWVGLSIVITTYTLASGLIAAGMEWWQGLLTVALGNLIVLIPILLNSHPGAKYGIPFPVLVRSSFGIRGANVAAMARALVACGWFGIQTWIGALALDTLMTTLTSGWADVAGHKAIAFGVFWVLQVAIILRGIDGIKFLESYAAPLLLGGSVGLLIWAFGAAGNVFEASSQLVGGNESFWALFGPGLAANVGYWITLSMNIPDFTRYAKSQRSQVIGQSIAMPLTMTGFSFIGIAVTCATIIEFGEPIWDPVTLVARLLDDLPILLIVAMIIVVIAQIAPDLVSHGRPDHRGDRDRVVPLEAVRGRGRLHLHVAGRLRQPAGLVPRRDGARLLAAAARAAGARGALPAGPGRPLLVLERLQLARAGRRRGGRDPGAAGLHERGDDRGRDRRRPELPRRALQVRRVRRLRPLRGDVRRPHALGDPGAVACPGDGGVTSGASVSWKTA